MQALLGGWPDIQTKKDVNGLVERDCIIKETMNYIRIKTCADSPTLSRTTSPIQSSLIRHIVPILPALPWRASDSLDSSLLSFAPLVEDDDLGRMVVLLKGFLLEEDRGGGGDG
ncbi:hypothetical protein RJ641_019710 [Dillenia turbinata]|uniref:Uncharacterized protein n=1 Tax=Dillenia turbinata TaxID=194707 RepID=A0AAN8UPY0_9MAGN